MEEIIVTISPTGDVQVTVEGVTGSGCAVLTKALQDALGTTTEDRKTAEYFQAKTHGQLRAEN
jgi:hypothetical protein